MSFASMGLPRELCANLTALGYNQATPIQRLAIPAILARQDVMATAQTGTGKTAAFTIPILGLMLKTRQPEKHPLIKALILAPTRELAKQVHEFVDCYGKNLGFKTISLFGGVETHVQVEKIKLGADIVIATPGRLMDHVDAGRINLRNVRYLVVDEADRMFDMGFIPEIRRLLAQLPRARQSLLFSATFPPKVKDFAGSVLKKPQFIQAEKLNSASDRVTQVVHPVDLPKKPALLAYLIGHHNWKQVMVFTRTKASADLLARELTLDGISNAVIHGERTQSQRAKALHAFKQGDVKVLVATDIAGRGLDIAGLPYVVNYELPTIPEDYVHRVGRTGRAGKNGVAITLVTAKEAYRLDEVERFIKKKIPQKTVPGFEPVTFDKALISKDIKRRQGAKAINKAKSKPSGATAVQAKSAQNQKKKGQDVHSKRTKGSPDPKIKSKKRSNSNMLHQSV